MDTCRWFLRCENPATTTQDHPILGAVAICQPCADKVARIAAPAPAKPRHRVLHRPAASAPWTVVLYTPDHPMRAMWHVSSHTTEEEARLAADAEDIKAARWAAELGAKS